TEWRDEYLGVGAIIKNTAAAVNGVTLKGAGAGAQWPVDMNGPTVPHHFANREFTLAAAVSIHEVPESGNVPLVGVGMSDPNSTVLIGISYTHEKKRSSMTPSDANPDKPALFDWKPNTTYQVTFEMNTDGCYVFVDGRGLCMQKEEEESFETLLEKHRISYLFIGWGSARGTESSHMTVTNVILYNHTVYGEGLEQLNASTVPIPQSGVAKQQRKHEGDPSSGDSTVHLSVSPVLLLPALVLQLWGMAALC
ncbi:putative trans-sialidase, partial [Trypanosoma cruzi]